MGQDCYALGMNRTIDFKLFEDEFRTESISEGVQLIYGLRILLTLLVSDQKFLPQIDQGSIKILDRKTWTVFDQYVFRSSSQLISSMLTPALGGSSTTLR